MSNKSVKVFLLGGQSNMVGADKASKLEAMYQKPFSKIKIWDPQENRWKPLAPEAVNTKGRFGPEISFGHSMAKEFPNEDIRLIKYAVGGTALYNDWSPSKNGVQYTEFMKTVQAALANLNREGLNFEISAMLWFQGESDADENQADSYRENLSKFILNMRSEFNTHDMPFILGRVRCYFGGETGQAKIVREAQVAIAESTANVVWFDTDEFSMFALDHEAVGHYDAKGSVDIGNKFTEKYIELINSQAL